MSAQPPPPDGAPLEAAPQEAATVEAGPATAADGGAGEEHAAAVAALHAAFDRLRPQGSDAWNFLGAFTHLGDRYGPYQPGASDLSNQMEGPDHGPSGRPGTWKQRLAHKAGLAGGGSGPGGSVGGASGRTELEEAMAQVVEAFRFLSARVRTLEERLAYEDRPIDGAAWLVPAPELGHWVDPVAAHIVGASPGGEVLHADCGDGRLLDALVGAGVEAFGVEPRGAVALGPLERGRSVALTEVADALAGRPPASLGGLVLSGVVDRLPLHAVVSLLARARDVLMLGAPIVIVASDPDTSGLWAGTVAQEILQPRPLHAETWRLLLQRAGFVSVASLNGGGGEADARFALSAATPT